MSFLANFCSGVLAVTVLVASNGCAPTEQSQMDEEKEPHFSLGRSRVNAMDYAGAKDAFNEALEANPRSAAAHFQLALLFDTQLPDPAAAIFHYQEFLRLNPRADNIEVIKQRIYSCKQQLAADGVVSPATPTAQRQLDRLVETNHQLQAQVDHLNEVIKQWNAYYAAQKNHQVPSPNNSGALIQGTSQTPDDITPQTTPTGGTQPSPVPPAREKPPVARQARLPRTHLVAAGETFASIARRHGVSLHALEAANPGITPRRLRAGQTLNLPQ